MTLQTMAALAVYAFATSITPGPNNAMLLSSGANFGFRRTLPHMAGITGGFAFMLLAVGFGLGGLFEQHPRAYAILRWVGAGYLLYLAWAIATSVGFGEAATARANPMTGLQAAAFQWVNPKAWILAVGANTAYVPAENHAVNLALAAAVFSVVNFPCLVVWAGAGELLRRRLREPATLRVFNMAMALLLVASLVPVLVG